MYFDLSNEKEARILDFKVPVHLKKYKVPFSQCIYKAFEEGEFLTQWILGLDYSIWMHHFFIGKPVLLHPNSPTDALALNYMLNGTVTCFLKGYGDVLLKENRHQLFYVPAGILNDAHFSPGFYSCLHINFHPSHLVPIAEQYPLFHPMLSQAENKIRTGNSQEPAIITPYMRTMIDEMITCDRGVGERTLLMESRIRELLRLYFQDKGTKNQHSSLRSDHVKIFNKVEEYMLSNLDKDLSVWELARIAGIGHSLLQKICHRQYGKGIHELVIDKRMTEAAKLLLNTELPISEIVQRVSTLTFSAFSAAFRKYHHLTPKAYRKKSGHNQ